MNAAVTVAVGSRAPVPSVSGRLAGQLKDRRVGIQIESISGYGSTLQGSLGLRLPDLSLVGELRGTVGSVARLLQDARRSFGRSADSLLPSNVDGSAEWRASLSGSLRAPRVSIDLNGSGLSAGRIAGASLHVRGDYAPERLTIHETRLDWRGQSATAAGEIGLASDSSPLRIVAETESVSIREALTGLGLDVDVTGTASARLAASGTLSHPNVNARIEVQGIKAYGELLGDLGAEAEWSGRSLILNRLKLEKPQQSGNGTLEARGTLDLESHEYEFSLAAQNLRSVNPPWLRNIRAAGSLSLNGSGKGNLDNPAIHLETELSDLKVADEEVGVVQGVMNVSDHRAALSLKNATFGIALDADMTMDGAFPLRFDVTATKLPYHFELGGRQFAATASDVAVQGHGSLVPAEIETLSALLQGLHLETGESSIRNEKPVEVRYAGRRFYLQPVTFASGDMRLQASGELPLENAGEPGNLLLTGNFDLGSIPQFFSLEESLKVQGKANLQVEVRGSWQNLDTSASMTLQGASLRSPMVPEVLNDLSATIRLDHQNVSVDSLSARIGDGTILASASAPVDFFLSREAKERVSIQPARFSVTADKVSLAAQSGVAAVFSGKLTGESAQPRLEAVNGWLEALEFSLARESFSIRQAEPATLTIADGRIGIHAWRWVSPNGSLQVDGNVGIVGEYPLELRISGEAEAGLCSLLNPSVSGKGAVRMDLRAVGTLREPLLSGALETQKASIGIQQPRLLLEDLDLKIELDRGRFDIRALSGSLNGGRIQGSGTASIRGKRLEAMQIDLTGQDIFLEYPPGVRSSSNLRIQARAGESGIVIGGGIEMREGSYLEPFDLSSKSAVELISPGESRKKTEILGSSVRYDLKIRTLQPFQINNNLARVSARADLRLAGDPASPGLLGTITLDRGGKLYFGGRVYYTERGGVSFANENRIDPVYNLVTTTQVDEYQVALRLTGTGSDIAATFTSDPPLSRNDIVALLLTGKPASKSGGAGVDPGQAEKMSMLTGVLNADLSARMRRRFGISQVTIQPGLITGESDPGARLTIGQDLSQSLRFVYSMNLVNSADQVWYTEYDFQRRFTARATMQEDNTYRTDFQQDFRFGGQRPEPGERATTSPKKLRVGKVEFNGTPVFDPATLAREFKVASGSKFSFVESRKGIERLQKFYGSKGYLGARIYLDREDQAGRVNLVVQVEAGMKVSIQYSGAKVPGSVAKEVRSIWLEGIADRQRTDDAVSRLRVHFFKEGYPRVKIEPEIQEVSSDQKQVRFDIKTGVHYARIQTVFEGASPEHASSIAIRLKQRKIADEVVSRPGAVVDAVDSYYQEKGYYLAKVAMPRLEADAGGKIASMVFHIEEGQQLKIGALEFQGNKALGVAELKKDLPLREGSVLNADQLRKTTAAIVAAYGKNGFRNPEVVARTKLDQEKGLVDLTFEIKEGVRSIIQSVTVQGEDRISEEYIRRQLRMSEGQPQDVPETNQSIRNLYDTGAFGNVDVVSVPEKGAAAADGGTEKVDVVVSIQEVPPYKFLYGGYYDSGRGPGGIAEIESRNVLGAARVLGFRTRYDASLQEGRMYVTQPLWRGHARPTTATGFYRREDDYHYEGLSAERAGFTLQQESKLGKKIVTSYGYRFENVRTWYPDQRAPNPPRAIVAPLTLSVTRSTRDDFLDPTRGSFTSVAFEFGPEILGSTYGYSRYFGQYFKYFPLLKPGFVPFQEDVSKPRFVYATGIRLGLIRGLSTDQVLPTERFYAGGGTTVRGFEQDTLGPLDEYGEPKGGNAMLVLNNELRFPMVSVFDGVGFVDIGNVFPDIKDFRFSELRKTAGFGLRLRLPSLMLRFDYGFKLDRRPGESRGAFFFSIGQAY
jgi:outer membrane protein assembly complex protein YaeT